MTTGPHNYEDHDHNAKGESYSLPVVTPFVATFAAPEPPPMRSVSQIRQWLKQVMFRLLQKELRDNFKQSPEGCSYN